MRPWMTLDVVPIAVYALTRAYLRPGILKGKMVYDQDKCYGCGLCVSTLFF